MLVGDDEDDTAKGVNKLVVDGSKMYNDGYQGIVAEGYIDLFQRPDENNGQTYEEDTANANAWTSAGNLTMQEGTDEAAIANNLQLEEINKTCSGPEFAEVE